MKTVFCLNQIETGFYNSLAKKNLQEKKLFTKYLICMFKSLKLQYLDFSKLNNGYATFQPCLYLNV